MRQKSNLLIVLFSFLLVGTICFVCSFKVYFVRGDSMAPTFNDGQVLLLLRHVEYEDIQIGDIIVFHSSENGDCIKRVAALCGDSIRQENSELYINGVLKYQYITDTTVEYSLNNEELFVLGDNMLNSLDSREIGPIKYTDIVGKIILT